MAEKTKKTKRNRSKEKSPLSLKDLNGDQVKVFQEISKSADLLQVLLLESHFQCNHAEFRSGQQNSNLNFTYGYTVKEKRYISESGDGWIIFDWEVVATRVDEDEECKAAEMTSSYAVHYTVPVDSDDEIVDLFLVHVGKVACYPYFRNQVSQKSWESGLELPILPVISA